MQKLATKIVEKPWGKCGIDPRFRVDGDRKVGEIWFEPPPGRELDVMVKYLFTTERLSIQVHPDDATAQERGYPRGKDECWIVLDVDEEAELAVGTHQEVEPGEVIEAARSGQIVGMMDWKRPSKGDFIYNPAGTIHALGPGLTILEIQQAVDLTYRLYDYGRPRELHLEEAAEVVDPHPHHHQLDTRIEGHSKLLVDGPHFGVAWCVGEPPELPRTMRDVQLLPIDQPVGIVKPGECALIDEGAARTLMCSGTYVLAWSTTDREG